MAKEQYQELETRKQTTQETRSLAYQLYQAFLYQAPNRYRLLDKINRHGVVKENELTVKTIYLSEKARKMLRVLLRMIFRGGKAVVNQKYLTSLTNCCARQNKRLLDDLLDFIQYKTIKVWKGCKIYYYFCIKLSASLQEELRDAELKKSNSAWTKMSNPIYNNRNSSKEEFRSNAHARMELDPSSNISNLDNSACSSDGAKNTTDESVEKEVVVGKEGKVVSSPSPSNLISEKMHNNNALSEGGVSETTYEKPKADYKKHKKFSKPKRLYDMVPLVNSDDCQRIRYGSDRLDFTDQFITELVLKLSKTVKKQPIFHSHKGFIAYMTWCLKYEMHDAVKCSSSNFRFKCNAEPEEDSRPDKAPEKSKRKDKHQQMPDLPDTLLGKIRAKLIELYGDDGVAYDTHWFSKMQPEIDAVRETFELKAANTMVLDWIRNNCWQKLSLAAAFVGLELVG